MLLVLLGCTAPAPLPVDLSRTAVLDLDGARFDAPEGSIHLRTRSWGRSDAIPFVPDALTDNARVADGISEWWKTSRGGLEQGWTIERPPAGDGPIALAVEVEDADAIAWDSGEGADITLGDGSRWTYSEVSAWDADGVELTAAIDAEADTLYVYVDDAGARYPITVDPVVHTAAVSYMGASASAYLGQAIAGADVNGDGYADLLVSAYRVSLRGAVYVYHGGPTGLGSTPNTTLYPATSGYDGNFGYAFKTGDFNGDGYDDVIVGEHYYNNGTAYVFLGSATGVNSVASTTFSGLTTNEHLGYALATGDFNHDGYDDAAVTTTGRYTYGAGDIHYGGSSGLSSTTTTTVFGVGSGQKFGTTAASAGDVNNDGYDDAVFGSYEAGSYYGRASVFKGASTGISASSVTTITGPLYDTYFAGAVAGLGDVNGDGYDDIGVGATGVDTPSSDAGAAYIYYGSATGTSTSGYSTLYGSAGSDRFGGSLSSGGDVDGDGKSEMIVGATAARGKTYGNGVAYVYPGTASGPTTTGVDSLSEGTTPYELYGAAVASLGDVNGDGAPDIAVGMPEHASGGSKAGAVYVYYGGTDLDGDGYSTGGSTYDCDDDDAAINPTATEVCDGVDNDCDGSVDEGVSTTYYRDADGDGFGAAATSTTACSLPSGYVTNSTDCNDASAAAHPGATEIVADGIDNDCDTAEACYADTDGDHFGTATTVSSVDLDCADVGESTLSTDCSASNPSIYPGATEVVGDGTDQDCDGGDTCYGDNDHDGYGDTSPVTSANLSCADVGESTLSTDCDDGNPAVHPSATESIADGLDQDCSGGDLCFADLDRDGYGGADTTASVDLDCTDVGESAVGTDCDDGNASAWPSAPEIVADDIDQDCDGLDVCYVDGDGDGFGRSSTAAAADCAAVGYSGTNDDCDDADAGVSPGAAEVTADGVDQDCDGGDTCYIDLDRDTYGGTETAASADLDCRDDGEASVATDCEDREDAIHPGATEIRIDGIDQDCDGGDTCYADDDADGFGGADARLSADLDCGDAGEATIGTDCDDGNANAYPGGTESIADGIDQDCDGGDLCYVDLDGDADGTSASTPSVDLDCDDGGEANTAADCNDHDATVFSGATEIPGDGIDQTCDGLDLCYLDADGDGFGSATPQYVTDCTVEGYSASNTDCDDANPAAWPGAAEVTADGVDQDCDGGDVCFVDEDGDGRGAETTVASATIDCSGESESADADDCDDLNPAVFTGATEFVADGTDSDCDGRELCFRDDDTDGYGTEVTISSLSLDCSEAGVSARDDDCDDTEGQFHPDATEGIADGFDSDCDGAETCYQDADDDGFGSTTTVPSGSLSCDALEVAGNPDDCDDDDATSFPGGTEVPADAVDQDCDGGDLCFADLDGDGYGGDTTVASPNLSCAEAGEALSTADCDDNAVSSFPGAAETCNGADDNCDGSVDEGVQDCEDPEALKPDESGCACGTPGASGSAVLPLLLAFLGLRRR